MSRIGALSYLYRWELAPLLVAALARVLTPVWAFIIDGVRLPHVMLATAVLLALLLPRVRREGRPLLTALWLVVIVAELVSAASMMAAPFLSSRFGMTASQLGLWITAIGLLSPLIVIPLAASQARRGMRFAMLVAAAYLAPTYPFGPIDFIANLVFGVGRSGVAFHPLMLPWSAMLVAPLAVIAIGLIAYAFHHALAIAPSALSRYVLALLGIALVSNWVALALPAIIGTIYTRQWLAALGFIALTPLLAATQMGLVLGLVWLLGMLFRPSRERVPSG